MSAVLDHSSMIKNVDQRCGPWRTDAACAPKALRPRSTSCSEESVGHPALIDDQQRGAADTRERSPPSATAGQLVPAGEATDSGVYSRPGVNSEE